MLEDSLSSHVSGEQVDDEKLEPQCGLATVASRRQKSSICPTLVLGSSCSTDSAMARRGRVWRVSLFIRNAWDGACWEGA